MKHKNLLKKFSESLFEICIEYNIEVIYKINIIVNPKIKLSSKEIYLFLLEEIPNLMSIETEIVIEKAEIDSNIYLNKLKGINKITKDIIVI